MSTVFETLYSLAIELQINPEHKTLTRHHNLDRDIVENRLQNSILTLVMPGENINSSWQILRIFCLNLVNRAQAPVSEMEVKKLLDFVEMNYEQDSDRIANISRVAGERLVGNRSEHFIIAIKKVTSQECLAALGNRNYLEWISQRWIYWVNQHVDDLDTEELLKDINILSSSRITKIKGMGLPLASNFFADLGLIVFGKPDLHVTPIINLLCLDSGEEAAFRGLVKIAKLDNRRLHLTRRFEWLDGGGGLHPRYLDRLIYLIGSDNFLLNGVKNKQKSPLRRKLMIEALIQAGHIKSDYM